MGFRATLPLKENCDPMKVFLRSSQSGRYWGRSQEWIDNPDDAFDFSGIDQAITVACHQRLDDVEVIISIEHPRCELRLPVR